MLLLTSLADEILLLILSYFSTDLLTLCNLAVSSQRFNDLATPIIYYDINLCQRHSIVSPSFSTRLKQLHRTINERPTLAPLLRRLRLTWRNEQCQEALKNFNKLRAKLHWLRELELTISGTINLRFGPKSQKPNALEWSKEIKMPDGNLQINDIVEYLLLPDLKAMHIDCIDTRTSLTEILQHPSRHARHDQSLSLATLSFGLFHPHPKILLEILRLSPNLRELCCWIPGDDGHEGHWRGVRVYIVTMISVLSPARIPVLLEPIQHSLRSLNLGEATQTEWPHHDGSRMDMSSFSCLKVLKTVAKCMFSAKSPDDGRKGVYRLLPPTLEELDVRFSTYFLSWSIIPHVVNWSLDLVWILLGFTLQRCQKK